MRYSQQVKTCTKNNTFFKIYTLILITINFLFLLTAQFPVNQSPWFLYLKTHFRSARASELLKHVAATHNPALLHVALCHLTDDITT